MESFLTFYPGKELRAALDQRELEACVVQWDGTRRHGTTPNFAPELRLRSQVLAVSSNFAGLDRKTPQRPPHVEHAVTRSVTGCRLTSQRHECSVPCRSGASLASLPLGQVPRTCRSPLHAPGHPESFGDAAGQRSFGGAATDHDSTLVSPVGLPRSCRSLFTTEFGSIVSRTIADHMAAARASRSRRRA